MYTHFDGFDLRLMALGRMHRQMDSVFNGFGWNRPAAHLGTETSGLIDAGDAWVLRAVLPGVSQEALVLTATSGQLRVVAKRTLEVPEGYQAQSQERAAFELDRTIHLPGLIDPTAIAARLEHGVLTVRLPKAESEKPRAINVLVN